MVCCAPLEIDVDTPQLDEASQPLAQALARAQLAQELESARLHGETEQLRSALLASVSHDLRTPLTAMRGSIDSLLALGEQILLARITSRSAQRLALVPGQRLYAYIKAVSLVGEG